MPPPPLLLTYLYGDEADRRLQTAAPRLLRWCNAFDAWLMERQQVNRGRTVARAERAWREFLRECRKPPYELSSADIACYLNGLQSQRLAPGTIRHRLAALDRFFRWCAERRIDPDCPPGFNPAVELPRGPKPARIKPVLLLSRGQIDALLSYLRSDLTPLGRRDYAFFLMRLRLGRTNRDLQQLTWGQFVLPSSSSPLSPSSTPSLSRVLYGLGKGPGVRSVRWRPVEPPDPLPAEIWAAICAYLEASGRLPGIQSQDYVFAPFANHRPGADSSCADAWMPSSFISENTWTHNLRVYGLRIGIPAENLTLENLRNTATRLRLDNGASKGEIRAFLGLRFQGYTLSRLKSLPPLPPDPPAPILVATLALPHRRPGGQAPGSTLTHGFFARSLPSAEVQAMLSENVHGLAEPISAMRRLIRLLEELRPKAPRGLQMRLIHCLTQTGSRLADLIAGEDALAPNREDQEEEQRFEDFLDLLGRLRPAGDPPLDRLAVRREALSWRPGMSLSLPLTEKIVNGEQKTVNGEGGLAGEQALLLSPGERSGEGSPDDLTVEIATVRCSLRRTLELAAEAAQDADLPAVLSLADLYGQAALRLLHMLRARTSARGRLNAFIDAFFEEGFRLVRAEIEQNLIAAAGPPPDDLMDREPHVNARPGPDPDDEGETETYIPLL